jgi:hypothetical protein
MIFNHLRFVNLIRVLRFEMRGSLTQLVLGLLLAPDARQVVDLILVSFVQLQPWPGGLFQSLAACAACFPARYRSIHSRGIIIRTNTTTENRDTMAKNRKEHRKQCRLNGERNKAKELARREHLKNLATLKKAFDYTDEMKAKHPELFAAVMDTVTQLAAQTGVSADTLMTEGTVVMGDDGHIVQKSPSDILNDIVEFQINMRDSDVNQVSVDEFKSEDAVILANARRVASNLS